MDDGTIVGTGWVKEADQVQSLFPLQDPQQFFAAKRSSDSAVLVGPAAGHCAVPWPLVWLYHGFTLVESI